MTEPSKHPTISAVINTLNEESNIEGCLQSVAWCDEIVVVDMYSDDRTVEICRRYTDKIFFHDRVGYVEPARNFAYSKATSDWIYLIDADERCPELLGSVLRSVADQDAEVAGVEVPFRNFVFGKWLEASGFGLPDFRLKFFRRDAVRANVGIHEPHTVSGNVGRLDGVDAVAVRHHAYPTIESFVERTNRYTSVEAARLFAQGAEADWSAAISAAASEFVGRYVQAEGFRDEMPGFVLSILMGMYRFLTVTKLWELRRDAGLTTAAVPDGLAAIASVIQDAAKDGGASTNAALDPTRLSRRAVSSGSSGEGSLAIPSTRLGRHAASDLRWGSLGAGSRVEEPDLISNPERIQIGSGVLIRRGARVEAITDYRGRKHDPIIRIGDGTSIEMYCHIGAANRVTIGRNVMIAGRVYISDHDHGFQDTGTPPLHQALDVGETIVEDEAWIGEGAVITRNVRVGRHAVVGANAVVTHDVPPYTVVAGVPARPIKRLDPATGRWVPFETSRTVQADSSENRSLLVSIVVPLQDDHDLTELLCEAIVRHTADIPYEVIFVDNGISAETRQFLDQIEGDVALIENETAAGYAASVNQAATVARGELLVVLRHDSIPMPGWLDNLVGDIRVHERIVALAPLIVTGDGVPIAIGGRIGEDGAPSFLLECTEPEPVDFVSGHAFLVRRDSFLRAGGLDDGQVSVPAALARLCQRLLEGGGLILAEPRSVVVGTDNSETAPAVSSDSEQVQDYSRGSSERSDRPVRDDRSSSVVDNAVANADGSAQERPGVELLLVSIVVPLRNQVEFTRGCYQAVLTTCRTVSYELIFVDNASTDETGAFLSTLPPEVKVIRNRANVGFGPACNQGAEVATGKYIAFLNNDTLPQPGWLAALVATISADPGIGAVGPKFLTPDGLIAEAGVHFFPHGHGFQRGRGARRDHPAYQVPVEVDYCSAAALLVRRDLFERVGGFDDRYRPAYFEDSDLCFALRGLGFRTMYEPKAEVIHYEGTTSKREYGSEARRRAQEDVNRPKFLEKWGAALQGRWDAGRGQERSVLMIDYIPPIYDRAAGSLQTFQFIKHLLSIGTRVTFLAMRPFDDPRYSRELRQMGVTVCQGDPDHGRALGLYLPDDKLDFAQILYDGRFDVALISFWYVGEVYIPEIRHYSPSTRVVVDAHDVHFIRERRQAELAGDAKLLTASLETRRRELAVYRAADRVIVITEQDRAVLARELPGLSAPLVPNIHHVVDVTAGRAGRRDILFVGNYRHTPNVDAAMFAATQIFPAVRKALPDARLILAGDAPTAEILALASDNVLVPGYLPDLLPLLNTSAVSVAPLRFGSGMKAKIAEAMSHGLPVVTTSIGAEGMQLVDGEHVLVADSAEEIAAAIVRVMSDDVLWEKLAANGKEHVRALHNPEVAGRALEAALFAGEIESVAASPLVASVADKPVASIIMLTHNELEYTRRCIASIQQHTGVSYEIIVVDNGSDDGTPEAMREVPGARVIANPTNRGFAAGVNQGLAAAQGRYLVLLNNDTVVTSQWLEQMIEVAEARSDIGIVGPRSNYVTGPQLIPGVPYGEDLAAMERFASDVRASDGRKVELVNRLAGLCLVIKREVVVKVGGFDERFGFGNFEDDDFGIRAQIAGYALAIARGVFIHHYGSRTFLGSGINYGEMIAENWDKFKAKWRLARKLPAAEGYPIAQMLKQRFSPKLHFVALPESDLAPAGGSTAKGGDSSAERKATEVASRGNAPAHGKSAKVTTDTRTAGAIRTRRLSVALIVRNEESFLEGCLRSIRGVADEIVVIDTGSTDGTLQIAAQYGARIGSFKWSDDFAAARNAALDLCTGDWVLSIDADERLDPSSVGELRQIVETSEPRGVSVRNRSYNDETNDEQFLEAKLLRLFPRRSDLRWHGAIHEQIVSTNPAFTLEKKSSDILLHHEGYRPSIVASRNKQERDRAILSREISNDPNVIHNHFFLGVNFYTMQQFSEAVDHLSRCLDLAGELSEQSPGYQWYARTLLGGALVCLGRHGEAAECLDEVVRTFPSYSDACFNLGHAYAGLNQYDKASTLFEQAIAGEGKDIPDGVQTDKGTSGWKSWKALGEIALKTGKDPAGAIVWFRKAAQGAPYELAIPVMLAQALEAVGDYAQAALELERLLVLPEPLSEADHAQVRVYLAELYERAGDPVVASRALEEGIQRMADNRQLLNTLAGLAERQGLLEDAAALYERSLAFDSSDGSAWLQLGRLLSRIDRVPEARSAFERARDEGCDDPRLLVDLGLVCLITGDAAASADAYRHAIDRNENDAAAHLGLAMAGFLAQDFQEALASLSAVERLEPGHPEVSPLRQATMKMLGVE